MKTLWSIGKKLAIVTVIGALCFALVSCTDFKKNWAEELTKNNKPTDLTGAWEGTWKSDVNGHTGKLRCIITKQPDGQYEFHYWAQWQKVLSGSFRQNYEVKKKGNTFTFSGEKDLGKFGGKFDHQGTATATTFKATYVAEKGDKGTFELSRPAVEKKEGK